jgi:Protein of unknown function (DUF2892)
MIYRKNLYTWEQGLRITFSIALVAGGLMSNLAPIPKGAIALSGFGLGLTGLFGWCPACALVGKKLKDDKNLKG